MNASERYDFYYAIHKALRLGHTRVLNTLAVTDFTDAAARADAIAELRGFLGLARGHLLHENSEIHAALEARRPGASGEAAEDHDAHERSFAELEVLIDALELGRLDRARLGRQLYRRYALFLADDLAHMNEEEAELMPVLQSAFDDGELRAIEGRIVARIPLEEMARIMRLMLPAMNHPERVETLSGMRSVMPAMAFRQILEDAARPMLAAADMAAVERALAA